jgi:Meiotically up-regulated gene 113
MTRAHILHEIQRTAKENKGKPLGRQKFTTETGIKTSDWYGVYWARWGEALHEAGFAPNEYQSAFDKLDILAKYAQFTQELGRLPADGDVRLKGSTDKTFPNHKTIRARLGSKSELVRQLLAYCKAHNGYEDVVKLCEGYSHTKAEVPTEDHEPAEVTIGVVYLVRSGRFYKIGRSNAAGRRTYELGLQLPEKSIAVHVIRTDDPVGIEAYWHTRFGSKRKNGEWFDLSTKEVAAFRRRKTM